MLKLSRFFIIAALAILVISGILRFTDASFSSLAKVWVETATLLLLAAIAINTFPKK